MVDVEKGSVQAWLTSGPHPPESFKVPRPGSPNYIKGLSVAEIVDLPSLCILFHIHRFIPFDPGLIYASIFYLCI